jgi:ABC-type sugar transport system ATPase subunit
MVGREVNAIYERKPVAPGPELLAVDRLRGGLLRDISLSLRAGEITGMAGLVGAGRTELCRAIFGLDPIESGAVRVNGTPMRIRSPRDAVAAGIALVPEDRQHAGLARGLSVGHNMTMAHLGAVSRHGFLRRDQEQLLVADEIKRLRIKADSASQLAGRLSGGNQQKVVIAKWLVRGARVFLFDEPTRGIDVGAKVEVFETMDELARSGAAILMVSSELPELIQVADRILVMARGRLTGELPGHASQQDIMRLAAPATGEAA